MKNNHYVPILKGREGEYGALKQLSKSARSRLTPLIEVPPIPWDFANGMLAKTLDEHLKKTCSNIHKAWGIDRPLFLDTLWLSDGSKMKDDSHPLEFLTQDGRALGLKIIPVVGFMRSTEYIKACRNANAIDKQGACLRIQREDFADFADLAFEVKKLLATIQVSMSETDLLLDLRGISAKDKSIDEDDLLELIEKLPDLNKWRSFTTAGTAFPANLTGLPASDCSQIPRLEWALWKSVRSRLKEGVRRPAFGDYAISHPEAAEVDPRVMKPSASVRYTHARYWLIVKAKNLKDNGYQQFHALSKQLVGRPEYSGADFSWGDGYIDECGVETQGPGNLTTWRKVGTSHHLAFVLKQLSNFA
jgi:Beta protein